MRHRRIVVVANPAAGRRQRPRLDAVMDCLRQAGAEATTLETRIEGDGTALARQAVGMGADLIVAAGGDGTINEVLNGMADSGVSLGVLPFGTANVLAAEMNFPQRPDQLAGMLLSGSGIAARPGRMGDRLFLLMAGAGLDAEICAGVNPRLKRALGKTAYYYAACRRIIGRPLSRLEIDVDGQCHEGCFVVASKCRCYGGKIVLAPAARLDSDTFEVCIFPPGNRFRLLWQLLAIPFGSHMRMRDVHLVAGREVRIACAEGSLIQTDGDLRGPLPTELSVHSRPVNLVVPAGQASA